MRFGVLGPTSVWLPPGDPPVDGPAIGGPRLRALLVRLLLDAGRLVTTDRLTHDLYGAQPPDRVANALQSQVSRLRRLLGPQVPVEGDPAGYRLVVDPDLVDAHRFSRLAAAGRRILAGGDHAAASATLEEALALWRGPALVDVAGVPFAPAWAAHLNEQWLTAVEHRIDARLPQGDAGDLIDELRQLVTDHPLRERLWAHLLRALAGAGRPAEALAAFATARRTFADQLGADPSAELQQVHRAILRGEATPVATAAPRPAGAAAGAAVDSARSLRTASLPATSLPAPLTSFVGRQEELVRLHKLLSDTRLVTITGPGGAGKTRVALEAAAARQGAVRWIELAPLRSDADPAQAVLTALGIREAGLRDRGISGSAGGQPDPVDRLVAALADQSVLLVFDNCEHLVAEVARVTARLLSALPKLRVLATSREPLGITGEALLPLSGLGLPPADGVAGSLAEASAVRLFLDRAAAVAPESTVDLAVAAQVCRTLDGLPLAIELAAARLRSLRVEEIAHRLSDRFQLLSRGERTAAPRHQTLRSVVEWSWELLTGPEQMLARRLTIFAGGATLPAIEQVAGIPASDSLDLVTSLVEKSLVERVADRYRMLQTIRAYGAEQLAAAREAEPLRRAHADHFLTLARTADPYLRTAEQLTWLARLDDARDDLHAALRAAVTAGDYPTALGLVGALAMYWWLRGLRAEAATLAEELLAALGQPPAQPTEPPHPSHAYPEEYALCAILAALGSGQPSLASAEEWRIESLVRRLGRPPRQPFLYYLSAMVTGPPRDHAEVLTQLAEQERLMGDDPWSTALTPLGKAMLQAWRGDLAGADTGLAEALAAFRALGDRWGMLVALSNQAEIAGWRGDPAAAIEPMGEALRLAGELGSTVDMAELLRVRADSRLAAGDLTGADDDYRQVGELAVRAGAPELVAGARAGRAGVALGAGDLAKARQLAEQALAECPTGVFAGETTRAGILVLRGRIAAAADRPDEARQWWRRSLAAKVPAVAETVSAMAAQARQGGDPIRAAEVLGAGSVLLRTPGYPTGPQPQTAEGADQLETAEQVAAYQAAAALSPAEARRLLTG